MRHPKAMPYWQLRKPLLLRSMLRSLMLLSLLLLLLLLLLCTMPLLCSSARAEGTGTLKLDAASLAWIKQHPVIRWAPEQDYGPFVYVDQQGTPLGLSVDFLQLIGQKTGLQFSATKARPLSENLELAKRGELELITSLRPNPERAAYLGFTSPYVSIPAILVVKGGMSSRTSLADMAGKKVAVGKGYAVEAHVREHFRQVQWVAVPSDKDALQQLVAGQVDGLVADVASIHFVAQQSGNPAVVQAARVGFEYPLSFAWRKDMPQLGELLQQGLQAISLEEREKLSARWMPATEGFNLQYAVSVALLLAAAVAAALLLRRKAR